MLDGDDDIETYNEDNNVSSLYKTFRKNAPPSDTDDSEIADFDFVIEQDSRRNSFVS